jgi:sec-independent protein translocase protein TatA
MLPTDTNLMPTLHLGFNLNPMEIVVILLVVLLLFGSRLPNLMRNLGKSVVEFKKGMKDDGTPEESGQRAELPDGSHSGARVDERVRKHQ